MTLKRTGPPKRNKPLERRTELRADRGLKAKRCVRCGESFQATSPNHEFCSPGCRTSQQLEERTCDHCGDLYRRAANSPKTRFCSLRCRDLANPKRLENIVCPVCSAAFKPRRANQKYCSKECVRKHRHARYGPSRTNWRWRLATKGEDACRNCGQPASHLHHIVPRSKSRAGREDVERNGMPLCARCHWGWHNRTVTLYQGCLHDDELAFAIEHAGHGWVDKNYPLPEDVELVAVYASAGGVLSEGWEERNAERVRTYRGGPA